MQNNNEGVKKDEPGYVLGLSLIGILIALLFSVLATDIEPGPLKPGVGSVLLGLYVMAWGFMFLFSYYYSHKTFFLRALIWLCENMSAPKGRRMAFFYFALAFILGGLSILQGFGIEIG